jgi:hypothetical protein
MIDVIPARPEMADAIEVQEAQLLSGLPVNRDSLGSFIRSGPAFACVDGGVLAVLGIIPVWEDRSLAWGVLSARIGANMLPIHRAVLRGLDTLFVVRRVEAYVAADHPEGFRWMKLLGFECEGMMRRFHNNKDFALFSRIKE